MILVDTSVWVDHLRTGAPELVQLLEASQVLGHPFVLGELAMGRLRQRAVILRELARLPQIEVATDAEVLLFVDKQNLHGRGIGYVDAHLLASLQLVPGTGIWTRDMRLRAVADQLGVAVTGVK